MLKIYVSYYAKEGCREQFLREIYENGIAQDVRAEDGCRKYEYHCSVDDVSKILLEEIWDTKDQQVTHCAQPHMDKLREIKAKYIEKTELFETEV